MAPAPKRLPCCRSVGYNIASDGFRTVLREAHSVWIRDDLVGEDHRDSEFFCHPSKLSQESVHVTGKYNVISVQRTRHLEQTLDAGRIEWLHHNEMRKHVLWRVLTVPTPLLNENDTSCAKLNAITMIPGHSLCQLHLSFRKLSPAAIVCAVEGGRTINDQQGIPVAGRDKTTLLVGGDAGGRMNSVCAKQSANNTVSTLHESVCPRP